MSRSALNLLFIYQLWKVKKIHSYGCFNGCVIYQLTQLQFC